ncbi:uncharacterized protein LOC108670472 [Hyalella azteca]|uniref:Uncharacterized protein LOC108670472 n=1 Tax=Hyalella azteca TaxID=294128 RepID=A0A8B7NIH8_HYAAZ|nr:uncharacterized protein LOC108670472 [Hyalella azteca]
MADPQKFTTAAALGLELELESDLQSLSTKVGVLMSTNVEIAQGILGVLSAREVTRLQQVCRLWRSVGINELRRRKNLHFISIPSPPCKPGTDCIKMENRLRSRAIMSQWRSVPSFCLVLNCVCKLDAEKMLAHCKLLPPICPIIELPCLRGIISTDVVDQSVEQNLSLCGSLECPNLILPSDTELLHETANTDACNINSSLVANREAETPHEMKRPLAKVRRFAARINQCLNQASAALTDSFAPLSSKWFDLDTSLLPSLQQAQHKKAGSSCTLCRNMKTLKAQLAIIGFQNAPGVTFRPVKIPKRDFHLTRPGRLLFEDLRALLFFNTTSSLPEGHFVWELIRNNGNVAVVGGDDVYPYSRSGLTRGSTDKSIGMAVCGDNVTAASVIITTDEKKLENTTRDAMSKFLMFYDPCKASIAFVFTPAGRNLDEKRYEDEIKMFKTIYPTTPVFGAITSDSIWCFEFLPHPPGSVEWQRQHEENKCGVHWFRDVSYYTGEPSPSAILFLQF